MVDKMVIPVGMMTVCPQCDRVITVVHQIVSRPDTLTGCLSEYGGCDYSAPLRTWTYVLPEDSPW